MYFWGMVACIAPLAVALMCFVRAVAIRPHPRLSISEWTSDEDLQRQPTDHYWQLAVTYLEFERKPGAAGARRGPWQ